MKNWKAVYRTDQLYRAKIVEDYLNDREMQSIMVDKKDSAYQFGFYEIMVKVEDVLHAIKIIEDDIKFE